MEKILKATICSLIFCFESANSCAERSWTLEEWAQNSSEVYIGRIVSISIPELEREEFLETEDYLWKRNANRILRFKIYESLKGFEVDLIQISLDWCAGGSPELGVLTILYNTGNKWHVKPNDSAIRIARESLTNR